MSTLLTTFINAIGLELTSASTMGFQRKCTPMQELWNLRAWFLEGRSTLDGSLIGDKVIRGKLWKDMSRNFSFCWVKTTLFLCIWFMEAPTSDSQLEPTPKTKIYTQVPSQHTTMRLLLMSRVQLTRSLQHTETWWKNIWAGNFLTHRKTWQQLTSQPSNHTESHLFSQISDSQPTKTYHLSTYSNQMSCKCTTKEW